MSASEDVPFEGHKITHAEAVMRVFPEMAALGVGASSEMYPGRYWEPWGEPPHKTDLDEVVSLLINRKADPRLVDREVLESEGITCPYYAVRMHTLRAAGKAQDSRLRLHADRRDKLKAERARWQLRIEKAEELLKYHEAFDVAQFGSIYLNSSDFDGGSHWQSVEEKRTRRREKLVAEILQDKEQIDLIDGALEHIRMVTAGKSVDLWRNPFFTYMANLWVMLTGEPPPSENSSAGGGPFYKMLRSATKVIGGGKGIENWGQSKTLISKFELSDVGEGFRVYETGEFALEHIEAISHRGDELLGVIDIHIRKVPYSPLYCAIVSSALAVIDYKDGQLEWILKGFVLKPLMVKFDILSIRLNAQLGWVTEPDEEGFLLGLRKAAVAAIDGDCAASVVLDLACASDPNLVSVLSAMGLYGDIPVYSYEDLCSDYIEREISLGDGVTAYLSDDRAFSAAMLLVPFSEELNKIFPLMQE